MPKQVSKRKSGHAVVTAVHRTQSLGKKERVEDYILQAMDVGENPASVNYAVSLTHNLGNYESLRISIGVTMPARPNAVHRAGEVAKRIAHDMLDRSMTEWVGPDAGRRSPNLDEQDEHTPNGDDVLLDSDDEFADA